jgi:hypothetical protein
MSENSEMIIAHPREHLALKKKSLDEHLEQIVLSEEEEAKIRDKRAIRVLHDKVIGRIPGYGLARCLLKWNAEADREIKDAKKEFLLVQCTERLIEQGSGIQALMNFITNPAGSTLFNKILMILDDNPPDQELVLHLASTLRVMANSDFESLFSEHKYALSQIEQLTPHSLTILTDSRGWPRFSPGSYNASGPKITSDWLETFCDHYARSKGVGADTIKFIRHCLNELISKRMIWAALIEEHTAEAKLSEIGETIVKYLEG